MGFEILVFGQFELSEHSLYYISISRVFRTACVGLKQMPVQRLLPGSDFS